MKMHIEQQSEPD